MGFKKKWTFNISNINRFLITLQIRELEPFSIEYKIKYKTQRTLEHS